MSVVYKNGYRTNETQPIKTLEEMVEYRHNYYTYYDKYTPTNCEKCNGLGKTHREELSDYHKREYSTYWDTCPKCKGHGRYIKRTVEVKINIDSQEEIIPWDEFEGDPFNPPSKSTQFQLKVDKRDSYLEREHPELADLSYDKYDNMLEKYRMIKKLKK